MYKEFIRKDLLDNGYGVYGKILDIYREQMAFLETPSRFRRWLSVELDVPLEKINLSSLNSALQQQRKKDAQNKQRTPPVALPQADHAVNKVEGFQFSKPGSGDKKLPRINEL
ncbi:hypothetical protein [Niabella drilacis]|uniref:Uncharacterized protein n=1 Tax=Niabella drilacis (strain DSM 25811 / CCM 8410 / CCUG 62505 / LMG 26954 / E90) TaxID=1285928 RepID=A0A1G6QXG1_NIADE|nr:hypothetical protein [Niabella drilacis]SDC96674.1 hypothetical protein SAMN04487894_10549 [Niabella drilacis]